MPRRNSVTELQSEDEQIAPSPIRRSSRIIARRASSNTDLDDDPKARARQNSPSVSKSEFFWTNSVLILMQVVKKAL